MKVAFIGKGGAGKSVLAGTVCRHLARRGRHVLALDVDTMPGLAFSLGLGEQAEQEGRLPEGLAERVEGKGWQVKKGAGAARLVDRHAVRGPDGVRFLELGKLPDRVRPTVTVAFRHVMERFRRPGWDIVADLAAGTRQPMFGWAEFAPVRALVVEPSAKSMLSARRLLPVGTHLVANKVVSGDDVAAITAAVPLPLLASIPYDGELAEAERRGQAPIDAVPGCPAVVAAGALADQLIEHFGASA